MADVASDVMEIVSARIRAADRKVSLADPLDSLGLESLDILEITFDLEQRFDVEIPYNANSKIEFDTIGALVQAIERLVAEKAVAKITDTFSPNRASFRRSDRRWMNIGPRWSRAGPGLDHPRSRRRASSIPRSWRK